MPFRPYLHRFDDAGLNWLRDKYREQHGNHVGFEQWCRESGIVSADAARRILKRETQFAVGSDDGTRR